MEVKRKRYLIWAFVLLFFVSMIVHMVVNNTTIPYDSGVYWKRGQECGWNVKNITDGFRGYLLPYFFSLCYKLGAATGNQFFGYWIFSSWVFAFTFTISFFSVAKLMQWKLPDKFIALGGGNLRNNIFLLF